MPKILNESDVDIYNMFAYIYRVHYPTGHMYIGAIAAKKFNPRYTGSGGRRFHEIDDIYKESAEIEILEVIYEPDGHDFKNEREKYWIAFYGAQNSDDYLNVRPGGEGICYKDYMTEESMRQRAINQGNSLRQFYTTAEGRRKLEERSAKIQTYFQTPEGILCKQIMLEKNKGSNNPMYGVSLSGEKNGMYGKNHTEESKKKISDNIKAHYASPEGVVTKARLSEIAKSRSVSDELRQRLSDMYTGLIPMYKDDVEIRISIDNVEEYKNLGFQEGRSSKTLNNMSKAKKGKITVNDGINYIYIDVSELTLYESRGYTRGIPESVRQARRDGHIRNRAAKVNT